VDTEYAVRAPITRAVECRQVGLFLPDTHKSCPHTGSVMDI
jgi:hypothetical protein